jgi:hypothetical protein
MVYSTSVMDHPTIKAYFSNASETQREKTQRVIAKTKKFCDDMHYLYEKDECYPKPVLNGYYDNEYNVFTVNDSNSNAESQSVPFFLSAKDVEIAFTNYSNHNKTYMIFIGDSNVRYTYLSFLQLIAPDSAKRGLEKLYQPHRHGIRHPHYENIRCIIKDGQILRNELTSGRYSSFRDVASIETGLHIMYSFAKHSDDIRAAVDIIRQRIQSGDLGGGDPSNYNNSNSVYYIYSSIGLWDVVEVKSRNITQLDRVFRYVICNV